MVDFWGNLQRFYRVVIKGIQDGFMLKTMKSQRYLLLILALLMGAGTITPAHAWRWDEEEADMDETEVQLQAYRKSVESGMALQERIAALSRLIKLFGIHKRSAAALEAEREQLLADESAIQTVSVQSRQKAQDLFQRAFEQVRLGNYKEGQTLLLESEHLNPNDKATTDLRQKIDGIVRVTPKAPGDAATSDLIRRGVVQYLQNEPSKAMNFLLYAQQKNPDEKSIPGLVELVRTNYPSETSDILDARLNLIDQKLQKALEKIYTGEYLVAAKECQEVLDLEPENALALTRLGSVYYAMGQVKQARSYWKQALALDASNDVLKSFLQQSESETDRAPAQSLTYKVQRGDTLQKIAEKIYKTPTAWRRLFNANRQYLKNAYTLTEGQVLVIPPAQ